MAVDWGGGVMGVDVANVAATEPDLIASSSNAAAAAAGSSTLSLAWKSTVSTFTLELVVVSTIMVDAADGLPIRERALMLLGREGAAAACTPSLRAHPLPLPDKILNRVVK